MEATSGSTRTTTTPELEVKPLEQELLPAKLTLASGPVSECSSIDSASIALEIQYPPQCTSQESSLDNVLPAAYDQESVSSS